MFFYVLFTSFFYWNWILIKFEKTKENIEYRFSQNRNIAHKYFAEEKTHKNYSVDFCAIHHTFT